MPLPSQGVGAAAVVEGGEEEGAEAGAVEGGEEEEGAEAGAAPALAASDAVAVAIVKLLREKKEEDGLKAEAAKGDVPPKDCLGLPATRSAEEEKEEQRASGGGDDEDGARKEESGRVGRGEKGERGSRRAACGVGTNGSKKLLLLFLEEMALLRCCWRARARAAWARAGVFFFFFFRVAGEKGKRKREKGKGVLFFFLGE